MDDYGYTPKPTISDQIQMQVKALETLKATNPDLGGSRKSPLSVARGTPQITEGKGPRKWISPKTPEVNSDQNRMKLERQRAQRRAAYEKEQAWTKKQLEKLTNERLKLEEEEKKLVEAKKRWHIPTPPLEPIHTPTSPTSPTDDQFEVPQYQQLHQQIADNLKKMKSEFNKEKRDLEQSLSMQFSSKPSYETMQAVEYYMARDILIDIVNEAVDRCTDKGKAKKKTDFAHLRLAAAEREYNSAQDIRSKERAVQLISEEIFLQVTGKMAVETVQEWMAVEDYIKSSTQKLIINSAEAIATSNRAGREEVDPAYDLITATYFHMCKERRVKRAAVWKHTQTIHYVDPDSQSVSSGVAVDQDVTKLTMSKLVPVHLWSEKRLSPSLQFYIKREREYWEAERFTIQPSVIRLAKRVTGATSAAVSPSQRMLALGTTRGDILVYDLWYDSSNPVRYMRNEAPSPDGVLTISWSLDSYRITTLNESGSLFMWSMHPGGPNTRDSRNLEFREGTNEIAPSQLTLLLALDPEAEDFDFQEGPFARNQVQTTAHVPVVVAYHPSHTLIGSQNSLMVGFESGDVLKCNVERQISGTSDQFENTETVIYPTVEGPHNTIGQDIPVELFRAHKYGVIYLGFFGNYGNMISVDLKGHIFVWRYARKKINHYGWFEPVRKYWLEMAEEIYVTVSNESLEIYFNDDYALEKKKMKRKDADRIKAELEADRRDAEIEWADLGMTQVWLRDENKKQGTEICVYRPDTVDEKGSPFHIVIRQKETGLLLKHYSQIHKPVLLFASRLLSCSPSVTGRELIFMMLFPPSPPKPGHITFAVLKTESQLEVTDMRIDVLLTDEEHELCLRDDVASFQVSAALDASGSSYLYLTLLGSLLVFSLNTGTLVLSSRRQDSFAPIQWTPKTPTKLWNRSQLALACTRGSTFLAMYTEDQNTVHVLQVTDRNTREKRLAVHRAFKYWNQPKSRPPAEQAVKRVVWSLDGDVTGHPGLFVQRLVLGLVDDAVQKVDGEYSEEERRRIEEEDKHLAHRYFGDKLPALSDADQRASVDSRMRNGALCDENEATGNPDGMRVPDQGGDDLGGDEAEIHPTV